MSWDKLSMAEKAEVMRLAVQGGIYDLDAIRNGYNEYAKGGKIHIAPSKRGTFTAAAKKHGKSVQAFASQVLAHPENYSPAMRKKANFARNAAKWHGLGGNLYDGNSQPTQQMQKASDYRYVLDDDGEWNRVANDEMGRVFQGLTVTPNKIKQKFIPARIDNSEEGIKQREKFDQYRDEEGNLRGEPGLEIVSPEFDAFMGLRAVMPTYSKHAVNEYKIGKTFKNSYKPNRATPTIKRETAIPYQQISQSESINPSTLTYHQAKAKIERSPYYNNMGEGYYVDRGPFVSNTGVKGERFGDYLGSGEEQTVFQDALDPNKVLKVYHKGYMKSMDEVKKFNSRFPASRNKAPLQEPVKLEGVIRRNDWIMPVYSQSKLTPIGPMSSAEFEKEYIPLIQKALPDDYIGMGSWFTNGRYTLSDIKPENVGFTRDGKIRLFDVNFTEP